MRKLFMLLIVMSISCIAMAQSPLDLGIHAGWNNTKINMEKYDESTYSGFTIGAFMRVNFKDFYLEPALNFNRNTSKFKLTETMEKGKLKYDAVSIPLLLGYKILNTGLLNIRIFAGPQVSFLTKDLKNIPEMYKNEDPSKNLWDIKIGAGVDAWKFSLDIDFQQGLKKFSKKIEKPQVFNVIIGYRIL